MKKIIIPSIIIAVIVLAGGGYIWRQQSNNNNASPPPTTDAVTNPTDSNVNKIDYSPSDPSANDEINQRKDTGSVVPTTAPNTGVSASITRADQAADGTLQVRVLISGTSDGTCTLRLTKGEAAVTKEAAVVTKGTFMTCDGFDIAKDEVTTGTWKLSLSVTNANGTSSPVELETEIK